MISDQNFDVKDGIAHFLKYYTAHSTLLLKEYFMDKNIARIGKGLMETASMGYVRNTSGNHDINKASICKLKLIASAFKGKSMDSIYKRIYTHILEVRFISDECSTEFMNNRTANAYCAFRKVVLPSFVTKCSFSDDEDEDGYDYGEVISKGDEEEISSRHRIKKKRLGNKAFIYFAVALFIYLVYLKYGRTSYANVYRSKKL
jgi:hypothetical protein